MKMGSPSEFSPKSHRLRDFLPSVKPSCLSLILVLVCAMNVMRNESASDRLLALEKQVKILSSSKSCDETGSPSNHDKTSENLITDPATLARKTAKYLEKKPYFPKGKNHSMMMNLDFSRTATYVSLAVFTCCRNE